MSAPALSAQSPSAFDAAAGTYDRQFTDSRLGRALRSRLWQTLDEAFPAGSEVLELGCGTGEDALHLARRGVRVSATDASEEMLTVAAEKVRRAGREDLVALSRLVLTAAAPTLPAPLQGDRFDGVYSSFGALNCVADRRPLAVSLAALLRPDAPLVFVLMGPFCLAETALLLARCRFRESFRRLRSGALASVNGARLPVWYPSARALAKELSPFFEYRRRRGLGVLLPPSDRAALLEGHPRLLTCLDRIDRLVCDVPFSTSLADHYVVEMRRRA